MKRPLLLALALLVLTAASALPFGQGQGCSGGACKDCHSLSPEQATKALAPLGVPVEVKGVEMSEIPGLWSVILARPDGMSLMVYLDFSLRYLIQGDAVEISTKESVTKNRMIELNPVDYASIPLDDALVMGDPKAPVKVVLFTDPECPFCKKLHPELKTVIAKRPDIAFYIKFLPLKIHPKAKQKSQTILCEKSLDLLEKSLAGEDLPPPKCETDLVDKSEELAKKLRVGSTPTLIFPDGRVYPGYRAADKIIELADTAAKQKAK